MEIIGSGPLVVDVWSDVMCPFCYLGDTVLDRALDAFPHRDEVEVRYHSFLLMPDLPVGAGMDLLDLLTTRHAMPREQAEAMNARVAERGREVGLDFRFDRAIAVNTRAAHELVHLAAEAGRGRAMVQRLFRAYFTDGLDLSERSVLLDLAAATGVDREDAQVALETGRYAAAVDADLRRARELDITGVPFFVFDGTYAISGAQPEELFARALARVREERVSASS